MRLLPARPSGAAQAVFQRASREAADLSFAVGPEHLLLAVAELGREAGDALSAYGADAETIRDRIQARERDALASLGISLDSVRGELEERLGEDAWTSTCGLPVSPEAKRVLELATRRRRVVSPEQMLTALLEHSPSARRLLLDLDVPLDALAARLRR